MSTWFGYFGGGAAKRKEAPKQAILALREQLEMLQKRESHIEKQIDEQANIAKKNAMSNKTYTVAMNALKRKKMHEKTLETTQGQISTLEQQVYAIEATKINYETIKAMQAAGKAMKDIHGNMDIDKVDQVVEEVQEQQRLAEEMGAAISRVGQNADMDEEDLMAELGDLQQELLDEQITSVKAPPVKEPSGSVSHKVQQEVEEDDEEEELKKLQAEMAM